ncbi:molybdopterin-guanine dinucleotide biosynthesis protein B [Bacillus sp. FJAT-45350]|uniref:molybdopterin-guanine dinucleotide biosynthesis protein B n=1 Tax=Bacillus sp. FJAT-45350 TaxID=2011014 RepID=UPI000BB68287|nr:molybdopterin-guanine dinucleotide biosynthesis protein B [Bacillus sp. FJAT-45350]
MKVIQFAGFSNSGKTTLVEKMIAKGKVKQYKIATIKHHGHGKELTALDTGKDSYRHKEAGADAVSVAASESIQLQMTKETPWTAEEIITLYKPFQFDFIFIEGFKGEDYPKVVIIKEEKHLELLDTLKNIIAIVSWISLENVDVQSDVPIFYVDQYEIDSLFSLIEEG